MSTFFAFIRNSTSLKNHSDFKSDDEGIGYICLFVFVKMLVWVCICQNVCLHLSKCLFVFVKMFVCIRQNVCLFTWRRERALPAEEVLHQARLVLLVAVPGQFNLIVCLFVCFCCIFVEICLLFVKDSTCFAFGGRPRPFGLLDKSIASPSACAFAWLLPTGGLPLPLPTLSIGKVDPSSSPDETTLVVIWSEDETTLVIWSEDETTPDVIIWSEETPSSSTSSLAPIAPLNSNSPACKLER